jgi:cysteinyl-tRNA synthetase
MKIYDSLSQKELELNEQNITIYNCGPTVYNDVHIGNIRPLITFDILCRYLRLVDKNVKYAHNFTDIDDKIINRAMEENLTETEVAEKYIKEYKKVMDSLNVVEPDYLPKVSDNIEGIVGFVEDLVKKYKAYVGNEAVYFDIDTVKSTYGELSKQKISELLDGTRKENNDEKKSPLDFAL